MKFNFTHVSYYVLGGRLTENIRLRVLRSTQRNTVRLMDLRHTDYHRSGAVAQGESNISTLKVSATTKRSVHTPIKTGTNIARHRVIFYLTSCLHTTTRISRDVAQ